MAIELSKKQKQTNGSACSLGTIVPVLALVAVGALAFALRQSRTENLALQARVVALETETSDAKARLGAAETNKALLLKPVEDQLAAEKKKAEEAQKKVEELTKEKDTQAEKVKSLEGEITAMKDKQKICQDAAQAAATALAEATHKPPPPPKARRTLM